uniref:Translation initiation factor eIF2B subunit alpha n=1 Tax=Lotharella globosa TaxID=91324 RepID=A0A7S3Z751_9EUKA
MAVAAVHALTKVIERSKAQTMMELQKDLKDAVESLKEEVKSSISLKASCELFSRYVTRTSLDITDFSKCRQRLITRGKEFAEASMESRSRIANFGVRFIQNGTRILVHGSSRVVNHLLMHAHKSGKKFSVMITEGRPECSGYKTAKELAKRGILCKLILDSAVATTMDDTDLVLVGAEGVVENGGVINKVGTYQIAMVASLLRKPVYVASESYKFTRIFPLCQQDVPQRVDNYHAELKKVGVGPPSNVPFFNPACDYTPPKFITLLFTDLGILTPSAVSDELIKLYY